MAFGDDEPLRQRRLSTRQAINLAMEGRWREAALLNQGIIASFPNDVDAYNRLGRAYVELGEYARAREAYGHARELDPYNAIADKNLKRLALLGEKATTENAAHGVEPQVFIEETGKAGTFNLTKLAPGQVLAHMVAGDRVCLKIDGPNLVVENCKDEYLGLVDARVGKRLIKLTKGGNQYSATVISSAADKLTIIIRETFQHPSQAGVLSFPSRGLASVHQAADFEEPVAEELAYPGEGEEHVAAVEETAPSGEYGGEGTEEEEAEEEEDGEEDELEA